MDAPPPHEDPRPFVAVAEWLASVGLSAPEILARDLDKGLLLLGDFGDDRLREALDDDPTASASSTSSRPTCWSTFTSIRRCPGFPVHGLEQWLDELMLFTDWYCPAVGLEVDVDGYRAAWREVLEPVAADGLGPVTVLRDYHAENVMLVEGRERRRAFRPARFPGRAGRPPGLRPRLGARGRAPRRAPEIERAMIDRYIAATGHGEAFERAYWALAAQRNTRILGVFTGCGSATASPATAASSRACGACSNATSRSPRWSRSRLVRRQRPPSIAARPGWRRHERGRRAPAAPEDRGRGAAHGDGHGRRPRQAHAPADRDPAQAADRGRRQAADRPCARPAARRRASSKVVVNVHYLADALEAHLASAQHGLESSRSDERELLLETGGGLVQAAPMIDSDPFLVVNSDNYWIDGPADTLKLLASHWDEAKMDALLLLVPQARASNHAGMGDFHMDAAGRLRRRGRQQGRAVRLHRHPDRLQAPAARRARRAVLDQHPVGPGDRGGPLLRRGPPGPVVRRRQPRRNHPRPSGARAC
jgi:hypothetical protein